MSKSNLPSGTETSISTYEKSIFQMVRLRKVYFKSQADFSKFVQIIAPSLSGFKKLS